jgi:hypothetical protein
LRAVVDDAQSQRVLAVAALDLAGESLAVAAPRTTRSRMSALLRNS